MATVSQPFNTDEENQNNQTQGQGVTTNLSSGSSNTSGVPTTAGQSGSPNASASQAPQLQTAVGGGTIQAGAQPSGPTQASSPKGTSSGTYTNLQKYMTANQNFNQPQGGLAGEIVNNINQYRPDIQGAQTAFNSATNPVAQQYTQNAAAVQTALQDPVTAAQNSQLAGQVSQAVNANYTGPKSLDDLTGTNNYSNLQNQANNFTSLVNAGQNEAGRYSLLSQLFNKPSYSTGQQSLDNLMLQGNQGQLQQLQNTRQSAAQVNNNLNAAQQYATATGQNLTNQANTLSSNTKNAFNNATGDIRNSLTQSVQQAQDSNTKLMQDLASGKITADEATKLGIGNTGINELYGVDPTQYINMLTPTAQNVANADQYAKYGALTKLGGMQNNFLTDPTQAGTFASTNPLDLATLQNAIATQQAAYNSQVNPIQSQISHDQLDEQIKTQEAINQQAQAVANYTLQHATNPNLQNTTGVSVTDPAILAQLADYQRNSNNQSQADAIKNSILNTYGYKDINNVPTNGGWQAYNDWLDQNSSNLSNFAPTLNQQQITSLYGDNASSGNALDTLLNNGLVGTIGNLNGQLTNLKNLYGIGKGITVG